VEGERESLVWIGNWGEGERTAELETFLFRPAQDAALPLDIFGVRYPPEALALLARYGVNYRGWLPNARAPEVFARHLATVHVPRRFYAETLPGIPTIRVFEALACGIPLLSAPWDDSEGLFPRRRGLPDGPRRRGLTAALRDIARDPQLRAALVASGLATIRARHTCDPPAPTRLPRGRCPPLRPTGACFLKIAFYGSSLVSSYWTRRPPPY
jgi:spore maturation protein CgeB